MSNGTKWCFLDGHVGYGDWHHQIMDQLATRAGLSDMDAKAMSNYALVNALPAVQGHDVAWGHFHNGIPVFWRTNADRNAINTAVRGGLQAIDDATATVPSDSLDSSNYNQNGGNVSVAHTVESLFGGTPSGLHIVHQPEVTDRTPYLTYHGDVQNLDPIYWGREVPGLVNAHDETGNIMGSLLYTKKPEITYGNHIPERLYVEEMSVHPQYRNTQLAFELARHMIEAHPTLPIQADLEEHRLQPLVERYNRSLGYGTRVKDDEWSGQKGVRPEPLQAFGGRRPSIFADVAPWYIVEGKVIVGDFGYTPEEIGWEDGMTWGWLDLDGKITAHAGRPDHMTLSRVAGVVLSRYPGMVARLPSEAPVSSSKATGWWIEGDTPPEAS